MDPRPDDPTTITPNTGPVTEPAVAPMPEIANGAAPEPAVTQPVEASAAPTGGSRTRWLVGGGVAVAAVAAIALAATFLAASPMPEVLKYLPRDSVIVVELRPELPGDQRQQLGNFLAHFPGFEDQSTLNTKLDEVLERITREASRGEVDYATRVKPLLAGPMAFSVTAEALSDSMTGSPPAGIVFVATTDGSVTCESVFGNTSLAATHRDVEIRSIQGDAACALHGRYLLVGTIPGIQDSLDARLDGKGVDGNSTYKAARERLEGDQLASIFVDGDPLFAVIKDAGGQVFGGTDLPEGLWVIQGVRVTDDALITDTYTPAMTAALPSGAPTSAPAAESRFATVLPVDTLGYVEFHGVGASVEQALAALGAQPGADEVLKSLQDALLTLGGTGNLTGWIEEAGVAVLPTDTLVGGAVLLRGTDAATAQARLTQIRNLLVLASTGTDITFTESEHAGVTITTVDLGDLSALLGSAGIPGAGDGARVEVAFAGRDDLVVIGVGEGVVERILDTESGSSLATSATYGRVIEVAGARNDLQVFIALDATLTFAERFVPALDVEMWDTEIKPYLEHLAGVAMTSVSSSSGVHVRGVLTVK
jgi:hypothetical protein